jgi:hypothetical protein
VLIQEDLILDPIAGVEQGGESGERQRVILELAAGKPFLYRRAEGGLQFAGAGQRYQFGCAVFLERRDRLLREQPARTA